MMTDNRITRQVEEYIAYKQSLDYKLLVEARELRRFAKYTREINFEGTLTSELALKWASLNPNFSRWYMSRRLETIHTYAVYAASFDSQVQIPQTGVFGKCHGRVTPYIYTENEVHLLINAAKDLFSPDGIRCKMVATALGLLWSTGLRPSELMELKVKDVCFEKQYLLIRESKFKKSRYVPLHETALAALKQYRIFLDKNITVYDSDNFFVTTYGKAINLHSLEYAFQLIRPCILKQGQSKWQERSPRLYDFRHTFACRTIQRWLENGEDVNSQIYTLSVYMGHVKPEDTYWYLTATPELLSTAVEKFEMHCGVGGCDEERT